jgi:hypothetical protein
MRKRHIVRGLLGGLLLGLGVAVLLFTYAKVAIGTLAFPFVVLIGVVAGLVIGIIGTPDGAGTVERASSDTA